MKPNPGRKLIYKENLNFEESDLARLSYDVVFRQPDIEAEEEAEEEVRQHQELEEAIEQNNAEWQQRLEQVRKQALQEGYDAGVQDGRQEARQQARQQAQQELQQVQQGMTALEQEFSQLLEEMKPGITSLIFDIAEKVIQVPVESQALREVVVNQVAESLGQLDSDIHIKLLVSGQDADLMREVTGQIGSRHIEINIDEQLNPGEYRIETPREVIEQNFKKYLADMRARLKKEDWGHIHPDEPNEE